MITLALRYTDRFAPDCGTIQAHNKLLEQYGFVWFGKIGSRLSDKSCSLVLDNPNPKILLIHGGKTDKYWAYIDKITTEKPDLMFIPEYYHNRIDIIKTWIRIKAFETADDEIMSRCFVVSSGTTLPVASSRFISSFFIIRYE